MPGLAAIQPHATTNLQQTRMYLRPRAASLYAWQGTVWVHSCTSQQAKGHCSHSGTPIVGGMGPTIQIFNIEAVMGRTQRLPAQGLLSQLRCTPHDVQGSVLGR